MRIVVDRQTDRHTHKVPLAVHAPRGLKMFTYIRSSVQVKHRVTGNNFVFV